MDVQIFYFSGTGNSLAIARKILDKLSGRNKLMKIKKETKLSITAPIIGFVFPIYFMDVPEFIVDFIKNNDFPQEAYYFTVVNSNGYPGQGLYTINEILKSKGLTLNLGFSLDMPGNAILSDEMINKKRLNEVNNRVEQICQDISEKKSNILPNKKDFLINLQSCLMKLYGQKIAFNTEKFQVNSQCTKCGICAKICPRKNIKLNDKNPVWGKACIYCLACFHWCPKEAIAMNNMLIGSRKKYHHPEISVKDMF